MSAKKLKIPLKCLMVLGLLCTTSYSVNSYADESMTFRKIWPCRGNASFCSQRIFAEGTITSETAQRFIEFMAKENFSYSPYISFNSAGGDVRGAIALGHELRKRGIDTFQEGSYTEVIDQGVEKTTINNAICASACVLAFIGGTNRIVGEDAMVGVHQFSGSTNDLGESAAQTLLVLLARYVETMGVSRELLDIAAMIPPDQMYWLSAEEAIMLRVDTTRKLNAPWRLQATRDGSLYSLGEAPFSSTDATPNSVVRLAFFRSGNQLFMSMNVDFGTASSERIQRALNVLRESSLTIYFNDGNRFLFKPSAWASTGPRTFSSEFLIDKNIIANIQNNSRFTISFEFPNAFRDVHPTATFSIDELASHITALAK